MPVLSLTRGQLTKRLVVVLELKIRLKLVPKTSELASILWHRLPGYHLLSAACAGGTIAARPSTANAHAAIGRNWKRIRDALRIEVE